DMPSATLAAQKAAPPTAIVTPSQATSSTKLGRGGHSASASQHAPASGSDASVVRHVLLSSARPPSRPSRKRATTRSASRLTKAPPDEAPARPEKPNGPIIASAATTLAAIETTPHLTAVPASPSA